MIEIRKFFTPLRVLLLTSLLLLSTTAEKCADVSVATGFRIGFAASKPFVASLVASGVSQGLVDKALVDVDDSITIATKAESCINQAKSIASKPARRVADAKCVFQAAQGVRGVLARHNLDQDPQLNRIYLLAQGAVEAFEQYYAAVNTGPEVTGPDGGIIRTGADGVSGADADKELARRMKELKKEFDQLKAPRK